MKTSDRLYPHFALHAQASGRWSTTNPPLATLPHNLGDPCRERSLIQPDPGTAWCSWDWDQLELRIIACHAEDETMLAALRDHATDLHTLNTCAVFELSYPPLGCDPHTGEEAGAWRYLIEWGGKEDPRRRFGKAFTHRLDYLGDPKTCDDIPGAKQLFQATKKALREQLAVAAERYLEMYPGLQAWHRYLQVEVAPRGQVRTFMGRLRRLYGDMPSRARKAASHMGQGGAADIFNDTCLAIQRAYKSACFVYQAHDMMCWQVRKEEVEAFWVIAKPLIEREWQIGREWIRTTANYQVRDEDQITSH